MAYRGVGTRSARGAILLSFVFSILVVAPVAADGHTGTVPGTVTVAGGACIQVSGRLEYGTLPLNPPGERVSNLSTQLGSANPTIINCDPFSPATILARGNIAASSTDSSVLWDLHADPTITTCPEVGLNTYGHAVLNPDTGVGLFLSTNDQAGLEPLAVDGGMTLAGRLWMPCRGSVGAGHTMTFSAVFTALQG